MATNWIALLQAFLTLTLAFVVGESAVVGIHLWMVGRGGRFSRHFSLGTLTVGLLSVPIALAALTIFARGP